MRPPTINSRPASGSGSTTDVGTAIHAATAQNPPVDADEFGFWGSVSGLLRKCTWAQIKAALKTYFDALYTTFIPGSLADGAYQILEGETATYGETLAKFDVCYRAANGKLLKINATDSTKVPDRGGFLILTAGVLDDAAVVMTRGWFRNDSLAAGFSAHVTYYSDPATPGGMTVTLPTTPGHNMKILGEVTGTAKVCFFAPELRVEIGRYTVAAVDQYDLATPIALANSLKTVTNAHAVDAAEHTLADTVNYPVTTANASDLATLIALTTALLLAYDAHDADAELVTPTYHTATEAGDHSLASVVAPTTAGECVTRLLDLKSKYNAHDADATAHTVGNQHQEATANCVLAITPDIDKYTAFELTAVDAALTINEPVGTPTNMMTFMLALTDNGVARVVTHNAAYNGSATIPLFTTTVVGETMYAQYAYKLSTDLWNIGSNPGGY